MTVKTEVGIEQNPHNGTWEVGWRDAEHGFTPYLCGIATRKAAEAELLGFDARVEADGHALAAEMEADMREEAERFPNLGYVRAQIRKLKNVGAVLDASARLNELLDMDLHEHITWPLPSLESDPKWPRVRALKRS
jgi:hypothetical protein